jgi:hypothetical protein
MNPKMEQDLVARETRQIRRSRAIFIFLLVTIAGTAGAVTYVLQAKEEEKDFQDEV